MSELLFLGAQVARSVLCGVDFDRNPFDDLQPRFFKSAEFERVVRDDFHLAESQVKENLGTLAIVSPIDCQSQPHICFHRVSTLLLKRVRADLIDDADTTTFLLLVDNRAPTFLLDHVHRLMKLTSTVAFSGAKNVARETL